MDIKKLKVEFEKLKYIEEKLEYLNFDEHLGCYVEKNNGMPVGLAAWVNGAFYGFNQAAKAQAVPEGFVLVPKAGAQYFSHDFNGDGFKYHDTLDEAKKEAEVNLDWYRDQVADGRHVNDMGEFNELSYGLVIGSAEYSIDHVVTQDDIDKGEYSYEVGTEILSLYLSEAQEHADG
jgi:hypothetical protein